ncbi:hypothetical protein [Streptomyces olivaceus]
MDVVQYEVRKAGTAVVIIRSCGVSSRMPLTCRTCGARKSLVLRAAGETTSITCPSGHVTQDRWLSPEGVRDVAKAAAAAGVDEVPAAAEIWVLARTETARLPDYDDIY